MPEYVNTFNFIFGISAILAQFICVLVLFFLFLGPKENKFLDFIKNNFISLGFLVSFGTTLASLFYSQIVGFAPCYLCWMQRIFMFPQMFLFGVAFLKKDYKVISYSFPLLIVGTIFSLYHNFVYYFGEGLAPCDASGVSCVQRLVHVLGGYISIPSLSLTSFFILITILLVAKFYKKESI